MTTFEIYLNRQTDAAGRLAIFARFDEPAYQPGDRLEHVHGGSVVTDESEQALLNEIYRIYNIDHPEDYEQRSLSAGDVVVINGRSFACQAIGWERLHRQPEQPIVTLEDILVEDEYIGYMEREEELIALEEREYMEEERYGYHGAGVEYYDDFDHEVCEWRNSFEYRDKLQAAGFLA